MKAWIRFAICALVGLAAGLAFAAHTVRGGALGSNTPIGPWTTGTDFGTADASAKTRAVVALRGLLALPASEARYYQAATDDSGAPLDGRCSYKVTGGELPARWWSLTVYDGAGYLVANAPNVYSLASLSLPPTEQSGWTAMVAPVQQPGHWLPTGGIDHFELTLRAYLPADGGKGNFERSQLPIITKQGCA
ncbi:DUF1214 domain-containing protein [soil metagenome]